MSKNPGPLVIVPAMTLAYMAMLIAMYGAGYTSLAAPFLADGRLALAGRLVAGIRLRQAGCWRWGWDCLSRLLPIPKSLPMDRFFQDRQGAYLMMIFGVAVAPLAEEMLFRGFLYPVLDRWLQTLFMTPRQIRRGCIWILILAAWGFLEHRLPLARVCGVGGSGVSGDGRSVCGAKHEARRTSQTRLAAGSRAGGLGPGRAIVG